MNNTKKGFTLLEILLVIAAIGILAAIVIVAINPQRQLAQVRDAERGSSINVLTKALSQYLIDNQIYPNTITRTEQEVCATSNLTTEDDLDDIDCTGLVDLRVLVPTYLASIPREPQSSGNGAGYRVFTNRDFSSAYVKSAGQEVINCPAGYIPVPGNPMYQTSSFCVMKYEAKNGGGVPISQPDELPWVNITQIDALTACSNVDAQLINNDEWMTIARNVEATRSNWVSGVVGQGAMFQGNTDTNPDIALAASPDDTDGYFGTNNVSPSSQRRTYTLSNGEVIWDFSGNVWHWLDDTIMGMNKPTGLGAWIEFTMMTDYGTWSYDQVRPSNDAWNSSRNMGQYYAGPVSGGPYAVRRGGHRNLPNIFGPYALALQSPTNQGNVNYGFRCVIRF